jgi:hypothetical protein
MLRSEMVSLRPTGLGRQMLFLFATVTNELDKGTDKGTCQVRQQILDYFDMVARIIVWGISNILLLAIHDRETDVLVILTRRLSLRGMSCRLLLFNFRQIFFLCSSHILKKMKQQITPPRIQITRLVCKEYSDAQSWWASPMLGTSPKKGQPRTAAVLIPSRSLRSRMPNITISLQDYW